MPLSNPQAEAMLANAEAQLVVIRDETVSIRKDVALLKKGDPPAKRLDALKATEETLMMQIDELRKTLEGEGGQTPAPLPPDPEEPIPPGPVMKVSTAAQLQQALDAVTGRTDILCDPRVDYVGTFRIRKKNGLSAANFVRILPDTEASVISGRYPWVVPSPEVIASMVRMKSGDGGPALVTDDGAAHYVFERVYGRAHVNNPGQDVWVIGRGDATTLAQQPTDITFDMCLNEGDPTLGGKRGLQFNVAFGAVKRSNIRGFFWKSQDSQAIGVFNGPGPYTIDQTYLEASGMSFMSGGAGVPIPGLIPTSISIRRSHLFKPLAWKTKTDTVKNLLELKSAMQVTIEGCVLENSWADRQEGHGVLFTVRNQDNDAPQSTIADVLFRANLVVNVQEAAIALAALDDQVGVPSVRGKNLRIEHNIYRACRNGLLVNTGFTDTDLRNNTWETLRVPFLKFDGKPAQGFKCRNNVFPISDYGLTGTNTGSGTPTLQFYTPGYVFEKNAIRSYGGIPYPPSNTFLSQGQALPPGLVGDDGLPIGADYSIHKGLAPWSPA